MQNKTLRFKLVLSGIIIVLIPLLVVGVFSALKASRAFGRLFSRFSRLPSAHQSCAF